MNHDRIEHDNQEKGKEVAKEKEENLKDRKYHNQYLQNDIKFDC